ncbi:MAG: hypothetical protein EZS28_042722, partial [Streblomastix strix]
GMEDDYDYYESQPARQDRMKSRAKPFGRLPFHPSMIQRTRMHAGPQFREEVGDVLATLVGYLNRDIKKINRLSSAVSAQKYIQDKHLGKRFSVLEQNLDDNVATPDNVVVLIRKRMSFIQSMVIQQQQDLVTQNINIKEIGRKNIIQMLMIQNELHWLQILNNKEQKAPLHEMAINNQAVQRERQNYIVSEYSSLMPKKSQMLMEAHNCQLQQNNKQWHLLGIQFLLFLLQKYQKDKTEKQTYITEAINLCRCLHALMLSNMPCICGILSIRIIFCRTHNLIL